MKAELEADRNNNQKLHDKQTQLGRKLTDGRNKVSREIKKSIDSVKQHEDWQRGEAERRQALLPQSSSGGLKRVEKVRDPPGLSFAGGWEILWANTASKTHVNTITKRRY